MSIILITGMSGTGKSTVLENLRGRGYAVVSTDEAGWCVPDDGDWSSPDNEWIWDERRITQVLDDHRSKHLFIDGCRSNQGRFYDRFAHVVVFTSPLEVMMDRVRKRSTNPFGSTSEDRARIAQDKIDFEPMLINGADLVIDTSASNPDEVADRLEALL